MLYTKTSLNHPDILQKLQADEITVLQHILAAYFTTLTHFKMLFWVSTSPKLNISTKKVL